MSPTPSRAPERLSRRALLGGLAGGVAALAGCGYRPAGGERRWSTGTGGFENAECVLLDGGRLLVVVPEARGFDFEAEEWYEGGELSIIDPIEGERTGQERFREPLVTAAGADETVYAALDDGSVHAVPIGSEEPTSSPTPTAADEGEWASTARVGSGISLAAGARVYAGGSDGVVALDRASGAVAWRWPGGTVQVQQVVPGHDGSGPAVYAVTDGRVVALGGDGTVRWSRTVPSAEPPLVGPAGVYIADEEGLVALAPDGRERWSRAVGRPLARPVRSDGRLYHVSRDGVARSLSPDGRERWRAEIPPGADRAMAAGNDRVFLRYLGSLAGIGPDGVAWRVELDTEERFDPRFGPFAVDDVVVLAGDTRVRGYWQSQLARER